MRALTRTLGTAAVLSCAAAALPPALAQVPAGPAFDVAGLPPVWMQYTPSVAVAPSGDFVVVWNRVALITGLGSVFAQRFAPDGQRVGAELQANTWTSGVQYAGGSPAVAALRDRDVIVVWEDRLTDSHRGRILGPAGPRGPEIGLGTPADGVAASSGGHFVVVSVYDADVKARLFDRRGNSNRPPFLVNSYVTGYQYQPGVASRPDGAFVVVWTGPDGEHLGVFGQRFAADGTRNGAEFRVNPDTKGFDEIPSVAGDADGGFVVAWEHWDYGVIQQIRARRYDAQGLPVADPVVVNSLAFPLWDSEGTVASDASGNFVVTWSRGTYFDGVGIWARRFAADMKPRGGEFVVEPIDPWSRAPVVASDPVGNFVVAWDRAWRTQYGTWGVPVEIRARRYGGLRPAALEMDAAASPGSNGNGVLEACETVHVKPAWRNVTGQSQTFTGDLRAFTGPPGATYTVLDAVGGYGTVDDRETRSCQDCYAARVSCAASRPASHWDATLTEQLRPDEQGQTRRWPVHIGGSFTDVPPDSPYYRPVETLLHSGVTGGCGPAAFCGTAPVSREQMAVFVLVAAEGASYRPRDCASPLFTDVSNASVLCPYVEELARRTVVSGCGQGRYCPGAAVTRAEMAVFVLRTLDPTLSPPACGTPRFSDVPAGDPFCRWIEELARRGIAGGCGGGRFCPADAVTRQEAAVFLVGGFALTLYGP